MQERKFGIWLFSAQFILCGFLFPGVATSGITPPTSCNTFTSFNSNGSPNLTDISGNPIISIDNTGQWPVVIDNAAADNDNACGITDANNYPCTVFKYKISNPGAANYQHTVMTIPTCLDNSMDITTNYAALPACGIVGQSQGNPDWSPLACGMRTIEIGKLEKFRIPVKGKNVGIGVISMTLVANNTSPNTNYYCYNTTSNSGILGPACQNEICRPLDIVPKMKALCTEIDGTNYRITYENGNAVAIDNCGSDAYCGSANCSAYTGPSFDACLVLSSDSCVGTDGQISDPSLCHCWTVAEIGAANGDTTTQTGYTTYTGSPLCQTFLIGGKLTLIGTGCY